MANSESKYISFLEDVANQDVVNLKLAESNYGDSWKKRGGVGAFMMLARKWDRLEKAVEAMGYDIFGTVEQDKRAEGIIDDIRDLRRYLMLVEAEMIAQGVVRDEVRKDLDHPIEAGFSIKPGLGNYIG